MNIVIKDDYTIEALNISDTLKYIREIQLDMEMGHFGELHHLEDIMHFLGAGFKIYQHNTTDRKDYQYFKWSDEAEKTITLTSNRHESVSKRIYRMEFLLRQLKLHFKDRPVRVWVKMDNIEELILGTKELN